MCMAGPDVAVAQDATTVGELVVTGSRIRRDTFSSPTPVSVISAEAIRESGNTSLGDIMMDLPVINAATNAQNSSSSLYLAGQARADIRGLGPTRTLVLVDGRRHVFSDASSPAVDLNQIPSLMIDRIETVAGGASAIYGSEAIAGVVNIIMKRDFDGIEADVQAGISAEGDGAETRAGLNWGGRFLDNRLNVMAGGEFARVEPIMQIDRDWAYPGIRRNNLVNPQTIIGASKSNVTPYGTFQLRGGPVGTAIAVTRDVRDPTTITRLSGPCSTPTVQATCQDDALDYTAGFNALQGKSNRLILRSYAEYELTDAITAFAEASYATVGGYGIFQPAFSNAAGGGTMPVALRGDNAFLNGAGSTAAQLRAEWLAAGLTLTQASQAQVGKFWTEFGRRDVSTDRDTLRLVGGMRGDVSVFDRQINWDWYAQYGELNGSTTSFGVPYVARVQQATDAIVVDGQVVCRDPAARAAGCVPWDLVNGASGEAVNWAYGQSTTDQKVKQTVVAGSFATDLMQLPAGPLGLAMGAEYRKEESSFDQDEVGASGQLFFNAVGQRSGEYDVREAFAEIRVPILRDVPFAEELTFEAAYRAADYSTIGTTDQYRLAGEWAPIRDIRFRMSEATAVRAPNIVELFAPQSENFTTAAQDPCDAATYAGASAAQQAARNVTCAAAIPGWNPATFTSNFGTGRPSLRLIQGGNPNLGPETAETFQAGVVIQPRFLPALQISVDYFKYNIEDQVGTIPINTLLAQLCYDSTTPLASNPYCALIVRDPTGTAGGAVPGGVSQVELTSQNVAKVKVEGYDASVAYGFRTADMFARDFGDIALRLDATWMYRWALQGLPGQAYTQLANTITNSTPEWKGQGTVQWSREDLSVAWTTRYVGSMRSTTAFTEAQLDPYFTGDWFSHDLRVRYGINENLSVRGGILNLTDEAPPALPETFTGTGVGSSNYDNRGRYFYLGATFRY